MFFPSPLFAGFELEILGQVSSFSSAGLDAYCGLRGSNRTANKCWRGPNFSQLLFAAINSVPAHTRRAHHKLAEVVRRLDGAQGLSCAIGA